MVLSKEGTCEQRLEWNEEWSRLRREERALWAGGLHMRGPETAMHLSTWGTARRPACPQGRGEKENKGWKPREKLMPARSHGETCVFSSQPLKDYKQQDLVIWFKKTAALTVRKGWSLQKWCWVHWVFTRKKNVPWLLHFILYTKVIPRGLRI